MNIVAFIPAVTVFIVNGAPRAGKDTLINMLREELTKDDIPSAAHSSIDPVKDMLKASGINTKKKTPADRKLLATLGDALEEHSQFRSKSCIQAVLDAQAAAYRKRKAVVFLHIREPELIEKVTAQLRRKAARVWRVQVTSTRAEVPTNPTDAGTANMVYDYTVTNNGTLRELRREAKALLNLTKLRSVPKAMARPIQAAS